MQGMAFGTGSAIAHRAVGAVVGSMSGNSDSAHPAEAAPVAASSTKSAADVCAPYQQEVSSFLCIYIPFQF